MSIEKDGGLAQIDAPLVSVGEQMMLLRLAMAEGRITREQFWQAVDAIPQRSDRLEEST
jgi:hypothetical protein